MNAEPKPRAPYASVRPFEEVLKKIRNLKVTVIDNKKLMEFGYTKYNANSIIPALKFLHLIDSQGRVTESYSKIRPDSKYQESMSQIVKEAYKPLFKVLGDDLSGKTKKDITDEIISTYPEGAKTSSGQAANLFIWLCGQGGIEVVVEKRQVEGVKKEVKSPKPRLQKAHIESSSIYQSDVDKNQVLSTNFNISITKDTTEDEILEIMKRIKRAVNRLNDEG